MMQEYPFGDWLPDVSDFKNPGLEVCENVIPKPDGYSPAREPQDTGDSVTGTVIGVWPFTRATGVKGLAVATTADIYTIVANVTTASGLALSASDDSKFTFTQFNNIIYASCRDIGTYSLGDIETDVTFGVATGSPPSCNALGRVGDFLVMGDMTDIDASSAPSRLRWSRYNDPGGTWGSEIAYQSGAIDLGSEHGRVTNISGRDFGLVFQERGISRITYTGGTSVFAKELFEKSRGSSAPRSVVRVGPLAYFLGHDGFFVTDGSQVNSISRGRIWDWFLRTINTSYINDVQGAVDWPNRCIVWTFSTQDDGTRDRQVYYNWESSRWSDVERELDFVFPLGRSAETLESLAIKYPDIDAMTVSLDSPLFKASGNSLRAFKDGAVYDLEGATLKAAFEGGSLQPATGKRTYIRGITPLIENDSLDSLVSVGAREQMTSTPIFSEETQIGPLGYAGVSSDGRYHRVKISIPAGSEWRDASGYQADFSVSGVY